MMATSTKPKHGFFVLKRGVLLFLFLLCTAIPLVIFNMYYDESTHYHAEPNQMLDVKGSPGELILISVSLKETSINGYWSGDLHLNLDQLPGYSPLVIESVGPSWSDSIVTNMFDPSLSIFLRGSFIIPPPPGNVQVLTGSLTGEIAYPSATTFRTFTTTGMDVKVPVRIEIMSAFSKIGPVSFFFYLGVGGFLLGPLAFWYFDFIRRRRTPRKPGMVGNCVKCHKEVQDGCNYSFYYGITRAISKKSEFSIVWEIEGETKAFLCHKCVVRFATHTGKVVSGCLSAIVAVISLILAFPLYSLPWTSSDPYVLPTLGSWYYPIFTLALAVSIFLLGLVEAKRIEDNDDTAYQSKERQSEKGSRLAIEQRAWTDANGYSACLTPAQMKDLHKNIRMVPSRNSKYSI